MRHATKKAVLGGETTEKAVLGGETLEGETTEKAVLGGERVAVGGEACDDICPL
jgi:hypothetical protein